MTYQSFSLVALVLAALMGTASATQITFTGVPTARLVTDAQSIQLSTSGSLVLAGTFANPTAFSLNQAASLSANYASVIQNGGWERFGADTISGLLNENVLSDLQINGGGKISGSVTDNNSGPTKATFFNNKPLYLWVFNAPSVGAATQMGIFRATSANIPWTFPVNGGGVGDVLTYSTRASEATIAAIGGFGTAGSQLRLTDSFNIVAAIPEPSTAFFGLITLVVAVSPRRRQT